MRRVTATERTGERATCPECGGALAPGRTCLDDFHDLLALEWRVPGAAGEEAHFLAVAAYNLQHPAAFVPSALLALRRTVADVLDGRATVAEARLRARRASDGAAHVRRRADTPISGEEGRLLRAWPTRWSTTVQDVSAVAPEHYVVQVRAWARAVVTELAATLAPPDAAARA